MALHRGVAGTRGFEIDLGRSSNRLITIRDRHERSLALGFIRHDAIPQPLHQAMDVLLQAQLARMAVLKVHLPAHVIIDVPEHLGEKLMTRLEGEYTPLEDWECK